MKAVELGLNYTKADSRFELCQPDSWNVAKDFLAGWAKVLLSTKHAQMQNEKTDDWPCEAIRPWPINKVWDMPVVFWLVQKKRLQFLTEVPELVRDTSCDHLEVGAACRCD